MVNKRHRIECTEEGYKVLYALTMNLNQFRSRYIVELALRYFAYKFEKADNTNVLLDEYLLECLLQGKKLEEAVFDDYLG